MAGQGNSKVSGDSSNVHEVNGKRQGRPPNRHNDYVRSDQTGLFQMGSNSHERESTAKTQTDSRGTVNKTQKNEIVRSINNVFDNDSSEDSEFEEENDAEDIKNELEQIVEHQVEDSERIHFVQDNAFTCLNVLFKAVFKLLPTSEVKSILDMAKMAKAESHTWLQCFATDELENGTKDKLLESMGVNQYETGRNAGTLSARESAKEGQGEVPNRDLEHLIQTVKDRTDERVRQTIEELARPKNIIISNLTENEDLNWLLKETLCLIGCGHHTRDIVKANRLGAAKYGRPRPVKVEFHDEQTVEEIINHKKVLADTENFYRVSINRDLNKENREREKAERLRRKAERQQRGGGWFADAAGGAGLGAAGAGSVNGGDKCEDDTRGLKWRDADGTC